MKYLSVCSGIEAATQAWHGLGWKPIGFSEIEPFPAAVLAHHYPETTNFGDMTKFKEWNLAEPVDLLVGGTPCQSFSVAGLRKGLDDPRGNLMLTYLAIAAKHKPKWMVWENVPGVLSSNRGRDFAAFIRGLEEFGYGWAYRVLDAQYFGVAQRRRRVFVVGYLGNWHRSAAVLFERNSLCGNPAPSREKGEKTSDKSKNSLDVDCIGTLTAGFGKIGAPEVDAYTCIPTPTLTRGYSTSSGNDTKPGLIVPSYGIPGNWIGRAPENGGNAVEPMHDVSPCLTKTDKHGVAHPIGFPAAMSGTQCAATKNLSPALGAKNRTAVAQSMAVRRLTPIECERLQGFPDGYTNIPWRNKPESPDGPRYKALGNSMAVPVMRWIGERIAKVEKIA